MAPPRIDPTKALTRGLRACRQGDWRQGHTELTRLAQQEEGRAKLPALFYSYLGQAMARCEGRRREGLELCLHAVDVDPFQPENHLNLAQVYLLARNRRGALRALAAGLRVDPTHVRLLEVNRSLGVRRRPPIAFLPRGNPLNRWLGRLSTWLHRGWYGLRRPADEDDDEFWTKAYSRSR